VNKILM